MFEDFFAKVATLRSEGSPFAVAVVVRVQSPASGKPGDKAIIRANGEIYGWIGGGCVQTIVVQEALRTINNGEAKLIRITPSPEPKPEYGVINYRMTCQSGGAMEIYVEPELQAPQLLIFGRTAVAQALCKLGKAMGYLVIVAAPDSDPRPFSDADRLVRIQDVRRVDFTRETFIVVSTQGENDEQALEEAVLANASYVAFVASPAKALKVLQFLTDKGVPAGALKQVKAPAGLDIGALGPEEIAISILAQIILQRRSNQARSRSEIADETTQIAKVADPICGMTVDPATCGHSSEYNGRVYYFCCAGCKQEFDKRPEAHIGTSGTA
jgi:xanthine dehydrogenase accessory factor